MFFKFTKSVLVLSGILISTAIHAGDYIQNVKLHANSEQPGRQICFLTSDLFDNGLCHDGAEKTYKHGPKNWSLYIASYSGTKYDFDSSCLHIFSESNFPRPDYKSKTPEQNGTLDIYASTRYYTKDNKNHLSIYNCSTRWTPNVTS